MFLLIRGYDSSDMNTVRLRWQKFKKIKRGYISFYIIIGLYALSFFNFLFINNKALLVKYNCDFYFPLLNYYPASFFGQNLHGETNYRMLKKQFENTDNFVILPLYPYNPNENLLEELSGVPPLPPDKIHWMGTDDRGRDVFARIAYGFNISFSFSLIVTAISFLIGILLGAISGYYGRTLDITLQRAVEIWSSLPFLYIVIIISSILKASFLSLVIIMTVFHWTGITLYVRGEVLREKNKNYVLLAKSSGMSGMKIIFSHILPNSLAPVITFVPFAVVGNTLVLVSLDFLGFGLPPPTPSWGQLIQQGVFASMVDKWWLVVFPLAAQFITLLLVVFIGESVRGTFDTKYYIKE